MTGLAYGLSRRSFVAGAASVAIACPTILRAQGLRKVRITQPTDSLSYMQIYIARAKSFF